MARISQIHLRCAENSLFAGAAFLLSQLPTVSETVVLADGAEVQIEQGNAYAVARIANTPEADVFTRAYQALQNGLDFISVKGKAELSVRDAEDEYLLWWDVGECGVIRAVSTVTMNFSVPPAKAIVDGVQQEAEGTPLVATSDHPGFRYYRLAQITEDIHDAYRNMYLAFELTLSRTYPMQLRERERDWIRRALTDAEPALDLMRLTNCPTDDLIQRIYQDARLPLFHAKYDRNYFSPQAIARDRQVILDALRTLTRVVLRMFEVWHDTKRVGGFVYSRWVFDNLRDAWSDVRVVVSDDPTFDPNESDLSHPRFGYGVTMVEPRTSLEAHSAPRLMATVDAAALTQLPTIRRFDVIRNEAPMMAHTLEANLDVAEFNRVEFWQRARVANLNQPKTMFRA